MCCLKPWNHRLYDIFLQRQVNSQPSAHFDTTSVIDLADHPCGSSLCFQAIKIRWEAFLLNLTEFLSSWKSDPVGSDFCKFSSYQKYVPRKLLLERLGITSMQWHKAHAHLWHFLRLGSHFGWTQTKEPSNLLHRALFFEAFDNFCSTSCDSLFLPSLTCRTARERAWVNDSEDSVDGIIPWSASSVILFSDLLVFADIYNDDRWQ